MLPPPGSSTYQHVLGHPALVAGEVGGDAEGETFLAEQRVAPVSAAERLDLVFLGEMEDEDLLWVARPVVGHFLCNDRRTVRYETGRIMHAAKNAVKLSSVSKRHSIRNTAAITMVKNKQCFKY